MELQALDEVIDDVRSAAVIIDVGEDAASRLARQRRDYRTLAVAGDGCDAGSDAEGYRPELTQFIHHGINFLGVCPLRVKDRFCIVKDHENLQGREEGPQGYEIPGVFDACTNDLGESGEELSARGRELVATDESTVITEPFFDTIVVKDSESE